MNHSASLAPQLEWDGCPSDVEVPVRHERRACDLPDAGSLQNTGKAVLGRAGEHAGARRLKVIGTGVFYALASFAGTVLLIMLAQSIATPWAQALSLYVSAPFVLLVVWMGLLELTSGIRRARGECRDAPE